MRTYTLMTYSGLITSLKAAPHEKQECDILQLGAREGKISCGGELTDSQTKKKLEPYPHSIHYSSSSTNPNLPIPNIYHFINDVENTSNYKESEVSVKYDVSEDYASCKYVVNHTNSPLFQSATYTIKVPSKVEYALRRHMPKTLLKEIHPDIDVARELCLLFISQLSSSYFTWKDGSNPEGWKPLKAAYLRELLGYEQNTYKKIRELLETPLMLSLIHI